MSKGKTRHECTKYSHSLVRDVVVSFTIKCCAKGNDLGFYSSSVMWKVSMGASRKRLFSGKEEEETGRGAERQP